jgi:hypothetical protein
MIADGLLSLDSKTANLPDTVVAELELNSVIPPPDKIEEERKYLTSNKG